MNRSIEDVQAGDWIRQRGSDSYIARVLQTLGEGDTKLIFFGRWVKSREDEDSKKSNEHISVYFAKDWGHTLLEDSPSVPEVTMKEVNEKFGHEVKIVE